VTSSSKHNQIPELPTIWTSTKTPPTKNDLNLQPPALLQPAFLVVTTRSFYHLYSLVTLDLVNNHNHPATNMLVTSTRIINLVLPKSEMLSSNQLDRIVLSWRMAESTVATIIVLLSTITLWWILLYSPTEKISTLHYQITLSIMDNT